MCALFVKSKLETLQQIMLPITGVTKRPSPRLPSPPTPKYHHLHNVAEANKARKWTHPTRPRQCARLSDMYLSPVPSGTIDGRHGPVGHHVPTLIRALVIHWVEMHTVYPLQFTEQHVMQWFRRKNFDMFRERKKGNVSMKTKQFNKNPKTIQRRS